MTTTQKKDANYSDSPNHRHTDMAAYVLLSLPILHILADVTTNYFPSGTINPGSLRFFVVGAISAALLLRYTRISGPGLVLIILIFYTLLSTITVYKKPDVLVIFGRYLLGFAGFFVGYSWANSFKRLHSIIIGIALGLAVSILSYALAQVFQLGVSVYHEDSFYTGGAGVGFTAKMAIWLGVIPYLAINTRSPRYRALILILGFLATVVILVSLRRTGIMMLMLGVTFNIPILWRMQGKLKAFLMFLIMGMIAWLLVGGLVVERYEARNLTDRSIGSEGRVIETEMVLNRFLSGTYKDYMFGQGMFNSLGFGRDDRRLHVGYNEVLNGGGLIGLGLFLLFHIMLILHGFRLSGSRHLEKTLLVIFWFTLFGLLFYYSFGRISNLGMSFIGYMLIGGILACGASKHTETNI